MRIKQESFVSKNQILFCTDPRVSVGVVVNATNYVTEDGKKIVKAGTPMGGNLTARTTPFTKDTSTPKGVLLHDVDVTDGNANGTLLIFGFVNLERLDTTTAALITDTVKTQLKGGVTFLK